MKKKDINIDYICSKYNDGISINKLSKELDVSNWVISERLKENNIKIDSNKKAKNDKIVLTTEQEEILFGGLLGDCCLAKGKFGNAQIFYVSNIESHTKYFSRYFKEYSTGECKIEPKRCETFDKRTNKTYISYRFRSQSNVTFSYYEKMWYIDRIKFIPKDLVLTPKICLMWYIGDGSINNNHKIKKTDTIKLSTNSFSVDDITNVLLPQLTEFEARIYYSGGLPTINIPRRKVEDFLIYIGECPFDEYNYKWLVYPYKNEKYKHNELVIIEHDLLIDDYIKSNLTICEFSKKININQSLIKYHLDKENIKGKGKEKIKYTITSPDDTSYDVNNVKEFCIKYNLSYSSMYKVISGRDKSHKGWKAIKNK